MIYLSQGKQVLLYQEIIHLSIFLTILTQVKLFRDDRNSKKILLREKNRNTWIFKEFDNHQVTDIGILFSAS